MSFSHLFIFYGGYIGAILFSHDLFYFIFSQNFTKSYLKFDISKHYESYKTAIKQLVTEIIKLHKKAEEKYESAVISVIMRLNFVVI